MNLVFEYIKYKWKAKGRHGIHSPFVYELVDKAFKIGIPTPESNQLNQAFDLLKNNTKLLNIKDSVSIAEHFNPANLKM